MADEQVVKDAFAYYDESGNGKVAVELLGPVMRACGSMPTNAEVEVMRQEIDPDGNGNFDCPKLQAMLERRTVTIEPGDVVNAFKVFDDTSSGSVGLSELKEIMCNMGEKLDDGEWNKFAAAADPKASGQCNYTEFVKNL